MHQLKELLKIRGVVATLVAIGLFAGTFALYQACWDNPFVLDDLTKIQQNPDMAVTSFAWDHFIFPYPESTTQLRNDPSRPLTYIVYWLCWQLEPNSPTAIHVVSTTLHAGITVLLAFFTAELMLQIFGVYSLMAGVTAALLFMTSPLMAGTVVYAYGLSDVLSGFLVLLGLFPLIGRRELAGRRLVLTMMFTSGCFLLALAAKQSSVIIAPLIVAIDLFVRRSITRSRIKWVYAPLFLISLGYVIFRQLYFGGVGDLEGRGSTVAADQYALFQGLMILKYIKMTILPTGFTIDHLYMPWDFGVGEKSAAWAVVVFASFLAIRAAAQNRATPLARWLGFGWSAYMICLLPTSSVLPTVDMFVERRAYIANLGLYAMTGGVLAIAIASSHKWRKWGLATLCLVAVGVQAKITLDRTEVYSSTEKLWLESLTLDNLNMRARTNLAVYYSAIKNYKAARLLIEDLLKYDPTNGGLYSKLGYIYMQTDYEEYNPEKALELLQKSLVMLPDNIFALYNAGMLLLKKGDFAEAERLLVHATELNPLMTIAHLRAGEAALGLNKRDVAIARFRKALELNDHQDDARRYLVQLGVAPQ